MVIICGLKLDLPLFCLNWRREKFGRPRKSRRKGPSEYIDPKDKCKLRRIGQNSVYCRKYGKHGHNRRTCTDAGGGETNYESAEVTALVRAETNNGAGEVTGVGNGSNTGVGRAGRGSNTGVGRVGRGSSYGFGSGGRGSRGGITGVSRVGRRSSIELGKVGRGSQNGVGRVGRGSNNGVGKGGRRSHNGRGRASNLGVGRGSSIGAGRATNTGLGRPASKHWRRSRCYPTSV
ncbi:hypothetical protein RHMOL_Rhmol06G0182000 [Rhododendron molle]|uniref:Uncharacterized protein n=1 Tax=Rhododendron molle TaxID=49168 RepID=A0ACC0NF73_RHOML|nr:hypothetical protein RHMOL_Rhmol06G0182000 [Rhododendron molle]